MPILKNALGLDVGSHALKAVELRQGLRTLEAVRMHAEPREPDAPLPAQLARMLVTHSFQRDSVTTALRADRISMRRLSFPFSEKRRVAQAVPFELEDRVPFEMDDMVLDWEIVGRERTRCDVSTVLAPRSEVSALIEALHEADCDPRTIEAEGAVLANLCAVFDLPDPCLLVDVGHAKTTLCAVRGGQPVGMRATAVAGRAFTEAVAQERALSLEDAERWKHEHGVVEPGVGSVFPRAEAVLERLSSELLRFASSVEPLLDAPLTLVLIGGGSQLEHLDGWLAERSGLALAPLGVPKADSGLESLLADEAPLAVLAPAVALAVRGTARAVTDLNLRQDDFARRADFTRFRRDYGLTAALAAAVVVLALLNASIGAILESRGAGSVESQTLALYTEAFPDEPPPADPVSAMREAVREANDSAEFLGVYRGNMSALDVLTEISRLVPADLDVGFEELVVDKQTIRIRVYASSFEAADRLGAELARFRPFQQARIGAIETDRRTGGKKFNVTIGLSDESDAS